MRLAGPLIVNNLSIAGMQFADAVMSGRLGAEALAAVAVGGSVWFLGFTVMLGLMMAMLAVNGYAMRISDAEYDCATDTWFARVKLVDKFRRFQALSDTLVGK